MELRIFNRRREEIRKQAGQIPPGQLTKGNTAGMGMAAKYVRYILLACSVSIIACWYLLGQVDHSSEAYETLRTSSMVIFMCVIALAVI